MSLIDIKNVSYSYNENKKAIDNISFNVEKGNYVTIIGHNGSGKSTLAKLIAGLLPLKNGEIKIDNIVVNEENMPTIRQKLGIVFQNPDNQFIGSTVKDDIAFGLENRLVNSDEMEDIIDEFATKVGLHEFLNSEPQNLSGGQKQRVAIAGVLAMHPEIIIFDEATSMLDPKGKKDIKKLMLDLAQDNKFTIISITHDIEEVLQSDCCVVLNQGALFMNDSPSKVFENVNGLRKIRLDIPFVSQIKEALLKKNINVKGNNIEEVVEQLCR